MLAGVQARLAGCRSENKQPELKENLQRPVEHPEIHFPKWQHWIRLSGSQAAQQNASVTRYVAKIKRLTRSPEQRGGSWIVPQMKGLVS